MHIDDVHRFYDFWENYDTIRDYSFLDEEDKEKGEDRETRKAIERQNRAERARRRAEELRSIRRVIELAKTHDPRLKAVDKAVKEAKAAKRQARLDVIREKQAVEAQQARIEAEKLASERAESEERRLLEAERARKQREQEKLDAKRERQKLRRFLVDQNDHFVELLPDPKNSGAERVRVLAAMDLLCQRLSSVQLQDLNNLLHQTTDPSEAHSIFQSQYERIQKEMQAPEPQTTLKGANGLCGAENHVEACNQKYGPEFVQTLVKAVNLLPAGTPKRWDAVAAYVNQHLPAVSITAKDALKQAKKLTQDDANLRKEANTKAFDSFASTVKETDAVKNVTVTSHLEADASRPWNVNEQRALEQALRSCPSGTPGTEVDRWQRIADIVGTRTRKECMLRCKQLAEQVRAKKAAMAAATKSVVPNAVPSAASRNRP